MEKMITRAKGGSKEMTVNIDKINIPDMWHLAQWLDHGTNELSDTQRKEQSKMLLETWYLVHDLKRHITESKEDKTACQCEERQARIDELLARCNKAIGFAEAIGAYEITAALRGEI